MSKVAINFQLTNESLNDIDSFSMGNITITGPHGVISSLSKVPDQSMMIFLSISLLLDQVRALIEDVEDGKDINFVGIDSSFQFWVRKEGGQIYIEDVKRNAIGEEVVEDFAQALLGEVRKFIAPLMDKLRHESVYEDICSSLEKFEQKL